MSYKEDAKEYAKMRYTATPSQEICAQEFLDGVNFGLDRAAKLCEFFASGNGVDFSKMIRREIETDAEREKGTG